VSAWQAARFWDEFQSSLFLPLTDEMIWRYLLSLSAFFLPLLWIYYGKTGNFVERWFFRRWPIESHGSILLQAILFSLLAIAGAATALQIQGVAQLVGVVGKHGGILAFVIILCMWLKKPDNSSYFLLTVAFFVFAVVISLSFGSGRRSLLSTFLAAPICYYWLRGLRAQPGKIIAVLLPLAFLVVLAVAAYGDIRHHRDDDGGSRIARAIQAARTLPGLMRDPSRILSAGLLGSDAVSVSLATVHVYEEELPKQPMGSAVFVAVNPIPRAWWPDKPEALGSTLPEYLGQWRYGYINWGPGLIGNFYADGGFIVMPIYALLFGLFMRWFDTQLLRDPRNPYLLAVLVAISGQWLAMPRGDVGVFAVQVIAAFIAVRLVAIVARRVHGTRAQGGLAG
jgi:hypothetical protein